MSMRLNSRDVAVIAAAGIAGLIVGGGMMASAEPANKALSLTASKTVVVSDAVQNLNSVNKIDAQKPEFPANEKGLTYGNFKMDGEKPDLVPVTADNGREGYARYSDLVWEPAQNPEEALAMLRERVNSAGDIVVPVFELDGATQIGVLTAGSVSTR